MNYQLHYDNLIKTRKQRIPLSNTYYEKHHIIMKSMGGTNDKQNLVLLTAREHFLAHWLLWRIYRNKQSAYAFSMMCNPGKSGNRKITSSIGYAEMREALADKIKGSGNPFFGKKHTVESNQIRREKSSKYKHSKESKDKITANNLKYMEQFKESIKKYRSEKGPTFSRPRTEDEKARISAKTLGGLNPIAKKTYQYDTQLNLIKIWDCVSDIVKFTSNNDKTLIASIQGKIGRAVRFNSNSSITEYKIVEKSIFSYFELKNKLPEWKAKKRILSEEIKKKIGSNQPKLKPRKK